jgi:hypothetical protein
MRSTRRSIVLAVPTVALAACGWLDAEPAVRVIRDPAGQRASTLLDAADTAIAHGRPEIAHAALVSAYGEPTPSPEVAYRVARLADRLDDAGTAAGAYRRYLSLAPTSPSADSVRTRLLALEEGPMRGHVVDASEAAYVGTLATEVASTGEVEPARDSLGSMPRSTRATPVRRVRHHRRR